MKEVRSRPRRGFARCINCGKELRSRNGQRPAACPTCGAVQKLEQRASLSRRIPTHEFYGANLVGTIVGGILGLPLGAVFAAIVYRDKDIGLLLLLMAVYSLGFAILGCAFGFMTVARATRDR